jgi:hypothetical protein
MLKFDFEVFDVEVDVEVDVEFVVHLLLLPF